MGPQVLIIGAGFGGLRLAKRLGKLPVYVTVVDRSNHHLFQPLLYQVALAGLSPADIAVPIRAIVHRAQNTRVMLGEVTDISTAEKVAILADGTQLPFDYCVVAAGAQTSWFGKDAWSAHAFGLKNLDDALDIRTRVLLALEAAELEPNPQRRQELLTFIVIGGGATGVEVAGTLAELSRTLIARDFRVIAGDRPRVLLVEAGPTLLAAFHPDLQQAAIVQLRELGVEIHLDSRVQDITADGIVLAEKLIRATTVVWAAGVRAQPLAAKLGASLDKMGRVMVQPDCSIPSHPNVFAIGDNAHFVQDEQTLPGLGSVAQQQGEHVYRVIAADLRNQKRPTFRYVDKGTMATIGRSRAVLQAGNIRLTGFIAWTAWIFVHIMLLADFRSRVLVILEWAWQYVTFRRGARLITGRPVTHSEPEALHLGHTVAEKASKFTVDTPPPAA